MANIKDGATGTVLTAPSPQSSGTSLTLNSGEGARFPAPPFWAIAHPNNGIPVVSVAEKILVTAVAGDTFTISRSPYGIYTAKNIDVGWRISNAIFQDDFNNASIINNEVPSGSINGVNATFALASTVHTTGTLIVYKNGVRMRGGGNDFTETATGFTMVTAPVTGTVLLVDYIVTGAINNVGTNSFIWDETPAGTVNGSTVIFTAARAYIPGSLAVYINGMKQKRGVHFTETTPASGVFTMGDAPSTGDDIMIDYQFNLNPSSNSDTVDGIHASATATANQLMPLNASGKYPMTLIDNPYRFKAYAAATTSLPAGDTKIGINTKVYDPLTAYNTSTSRFVAPVTGTYSIKGSIAISAGGSIHNAQIRVNGVLISIGDERTSNSATNHYLVSDDIPLAAGDYVELYAYNSGGTVNTNAAGSFRTYFSGFLISA